MESVRAAEIEKIFKTVNLHFNMCDCEIISRDCWEDTAYLAKRQGTVEQKVKEFLSVSEKISSVLVNY